MSNGSRSVDRFTGASEPALTSNGCFQSLPITAPEPRTGRSWHGTKSTPPQSIWPRHATLLSRSRLMTTTLCVYSAKRTGLPVGVRQRLVSYRRSKRRVVGKARSFATDLSLAPQRPAHARLPRLDGSSDASHVVDRHILRIWSRIQLHRRCYRLAQAIVLSSIRRMTAEVRCERKRGLLGSTRRASDPC